MFVFVVVAVVGSPPPGGGGGGVVNALAIPMVEASAVVLFSNESSAGHLDCLLLCNALLRWCFHY